MDPSERHRELSDLRVIEIGGSLAGRLAARHLLDQGAEIICIDIMQGEETEQLYDSTLNDRISIIDLETSAGKERLKELVSNAEVLIEGLGDEALASWSLSREIFRLWKPDLILCSLRTYPSSSEQSGLAPQEWIAASELGLHRAAGGKEPKLEEIVLASSYAALQAVLHISSALLPWQQSDRGVYIEVSLIGAGILALSGRLQVMGDERLSPAADAIHLPIAQRFRCADSRYIQCEGTVPGVAAALCAAFDHPEWTSDVITALDGLKNQKELDLWQTRFGALFASLTAAEWEIRIAAKGGSATVCRTRDEWLQEDHAFQTEIMFRDLDIGSSSEVNIGPAVRIYARQQDTDTSSDLEARPKGRTPLEGLRVLDLCVILAGPTCGRLLAELGAEVIKVDAPFWATRPYVRIFGWLDLNRNKRSILLDLETEQGREVFGKLIDSADIVLENYRSGKIAKLGFGFDEVASRKPRIVYTSLNAFDFGGTFSGRPGWDPNVQALTGMELARGDGVIPQQAPIPLNDYATGLVGAFGTLLGLRAVHRTGVAHQVLGSLARTASLLQLSELSAIGSSTEKTMDQPMWMKAKVTFAKCLDGWLTVALRNSNQRSIDEKMGAGWRDQIALLCCNEAIAALAGFAIQAVVARTPEELTDLQWLRDVGLVRKWNHPRWLEMTNVFPRPTTMGFEPPVDIPAQDPGEGSSVILTELGYSDEEIESLLQSKAVVGRISLFPETSSD